VHRLFVALEPPPSVRDALRGAMEGVAGARWQRDDQLHLTLRFIGEVDRHGAQDIAAALAGVRSAGFELRLAAPGTFDRRGRIDTLWIGVTPADPVAALHRKVDAALLRVGVPPDGRAFVPHVTIARFGKDGGRAAAAFSGAPLSPVAWPVAGFALYESTLGHDGADYCIVERYRLAPA